MRKYMRLHRLPTVLVAVGVWSVLLLTAGINASPAPRGLPPMQTPPMTTPPAMLDWPRPATSPLGLAARPLFRAHRFILAGGLDGHWFSGAPDDPQPTPAWALVPLVTELRRQRADCPTLVIDIGNTTSACHPGGWLIGGAGETAWRQAIGCTAHVAGPGELSCYRSPGNPPAVLRNAILGNVAGSGGTLPFAPWRVVACGDLHVLVTGLIDATWARELPLAGFGDYTIEDPVRAWRRIKAQAPRVDLRLVAVHGPDSLLRQLQPDLGPRDRVLFLDPGRTRPLAPAADHRYWPVSPTTRAVTVIETWPATEQPDPTAIIAATAHRDDETQPRVHTPRAGTGGPEIVRRRRDLPLRAIPEARSLAPAFASAAALLARTSVRPYAVIPTSAMPAHTRSRLATTAHAEMTQALLRTDLTLTSAAREPVRGPRVLNGAELTQRIPPHRLGVFLLSGAEVIDLLRRVAGPGQPARMGIAGGRARFTGPLLTELTIAERPVDSTARYRVGLDETIYRDPRIANLCDETRRIGPRGLTLWDAWTTGFADGSRPAPLVDGEDQ